MHFYTASADERDIILNTMPSYDFEGVAGYVNNSDTLDPIVIPESDGIYVTESGILRDSSTNTIKGESFDITIPKGHPILEPDNYGGIVQSRTLRTRHTEDLTLDASATSGGDRLHVLLISEGDNATTSIVFGGGVAMSAFLGKGTDTIHFGNADYQEVAIQEANLGGEDRATGMNMGDYFRTHGAPGTFTHDSEGNLVFDYAGEGSLTLVGVSSTYVQYGAHIVDGVF